MKKNHLIKALFVLLLFPAQLFAQDITGLWKGTIYNDTTKKTLHYELAISEENGQLVGYSYTKFDFDGKVGVGVKKLKIKMDNGKVYISDIGLVDDTYPVKPPKNIHQYSVLTLDTKDSMRILSGTWNTNLTKQYRPVTGTLIVQRKSDLDLNYVNKKLQEISEINELAYRERNKVKADTIRSLASLPPASDLGKRKMGGEIQKVFYKSDSITISLYDNGIVDGDIVTVLMNGNIIFSKQMLTTQANSKVIHIDKDTPDTMMIVLYAENLGSIPPNTGLLTVKDGESVYETFFSADLETNAGIMLIRKKPDAVVQ